MWRIWSKSKECKYLSLSQLFILFIKYSIRKQLETSCCVKVPAAQRASWIKGDSSIRIDGKNTARHFATWHSCSGQQNQLIVEDFTLINLLDLRFRCASLNWLNNLPASGITYLYMLFDCCFNVCANVEFRGEESADFCCFIFSVKSLKDYFIFILDHIIILLIETNKQSTRPHTSTMHRHHSLFIKFSNLCYKK